MKAYERIIRVMERYGLNKNSFSVAVGFSNNVTIGKIINEKRTPNEKTLKKIVARFPEISYDWLLTGEGEMLREIQEIENKNIGVPLIPVDAMAGFTSGDVQVYDYEVRERYIIPDFENKGVKFLIRASGSSMYPKYSNGDILACRPVENVGFIQWGKVYVLDTNQGPVVKRLFECSDKPDEIECRSDNKELYPPFCISKDEIRSMSIVVGVIRLE